MALQVFILFKEGIREELSVLPRRVLLPFSIAFDLIRTSWMLCEQIIFSKQTRANENGTDEEMFVNWTIGRRLKQKGKTVIFFNAIKVIKFQEKYFHWSYFLRHSGVLPLH